EHNVEALARELAAVGGWQRVVSVVPTAAAQHPDAVDPGLGDAAGKARSQPRDGVAAGAPAAENFEEVDFRPAGFGRLDVPPVDREKIQAVPRASAGSPVRGLVATTPITWQV